MGMETLACGYRVFSARESVLMRTVMFVDHFLCALIFYFLLRRQNLPVM